MRKSLDSNKVKQYLVTQGENLDDYMKETATKDGVKAALRK
jgi:hypothetical protein